MYRCVRVQAVCNGCAGLRADLWNHVSCRRLSWSQITGQKVHHPLLSLQRTAFETGYTALWSVVATMLCFLMWHVWWHCAQFQRSPQVYVNSWQLDDCTGRRPERRHYHHHRRRRRHQATALVWRCKCRFVERDYFNTSNAIRLSMPGEPIRLQVPPKLFGVNSWIQQMIRKWIPDCWFDDRKCTGLIGATVNSRNWQLISGRSQMLASYGDWHTVP